MKMNIKNLYTFLFFSVSNLFKILKWLFLFFFALWTIGLGGGFGILGARVLQETYGSYGVVGCVMFASMIGGFSFAVGQKLFFTTGEADLEKTNAC